MLLNVKVTLEWGHVDQFFSVIFPSRRPPLGLAQIDGKAKTKELLQGCHVRRTTPTHTLVVLTNASLLRGLFTVLPLQVAVDESATIKDLEAHIARTYEEMYSRCVVVALLKFSRECVTT